MRWTHEVRHARHGSSRLSGVSGRGGGHSTPHGPGAWAGGAWPQLRAASALAPATTAQRSRHPHGLHQELSPVQSRHGYRRLWARSIARAAPRVPPPPPSGTSPSLARPLTSASSLAPTLSDKSSVSRDVRGFSRCSHEMSFVSHDRPYIMCRRLSSLPCSMQSSNLARTLALPPLGT